MTHLIATRWPELAFAAITLPWAVPVVYGHLRWQFEAGRRLRRSRARAGVVVSSPRRLW